MDNTPRFSGGGDDCELMQQKQEWAKTQDMLKSKLILEDDFGWNLPSMGSNSDQSNANNKGNLKYIGGVDISFSKEDPSTACAALVVLDAGTLEVVHEEFDVVRLQVPYIPGFLAFREVLCVLLFWRVWFDQNICLLDHEQQFIHAFCIIIQGPRHFHFL
jgi:deoxyinosine 3'endonuclease (endonuclease V)